MPRLLASSSKLWWLLLPAALTALAFAESRLWLAAPAAAVFSLRALVELVEMRSRLQSRRMTREQ